MWWAELMLLFLIGIQKGMYAFVFASLFMLTCICKLFCAAIDSISPHRANVFFCSDGSTVDVSTQLQDDNVVIFLDIRHLAQYQWSVVFEDQKHLQNYASAIPWGADTIPTRLTTILDIPPNNMDDVCKLDKCFLKLTEYPHFIEPMPMGDPLCYEKRRIADLCDTFGLNYLDKISFENVQKILRNLGTPFIASVKNTQWKFLFNFLAKGKQTISYEEIARLHFWIASATKEFSQKDSKHHIPGLPFPKNSAMIVPDNFVAFGVAQARNPCLTPQRLIRDNECCLLRNKHKSNKWDLLLLTNQTLHGYDYMYFTGKSSNDQKLPPCWGRTKYILRNFSDIYVAEDYLFSIKQN